MAERLAVTCAGCGLFCDDVIARRSGDGVQLEPDCALGAEWFSERALRPASAPAATIAGEPVEVETALKRAAGLLRRARRPLLHGFAGATVEDVRAAATLADRLGALVSTSTHGLGGPWPGAPAVALRGASTATLGEVRDRAQLVVVWREDPEATHPRLLDRLGFGGAKRTDRTLVVVDDRDTATADRADARLSWPPARDLEALSSLAVLQRGLALRASGLQAGLRAELVALVERLRAVPHAAFVHGPGLGAGAGGQRRELALHELVRELSRGRHVVTLALPSASGTRSAQDVLAWQTGYYEDIDLGSGHPELVSATSPLDADVSLRIEGGRGGPPDGATEIALGCLPAEGAEVWIRTAAAGVEAAGTVHRLDGVPLTLQTPLPNEAPTAAGLLSRLLAEVEQ